MNESTEFQGRKLVIATMHQKERAIAPLLEKHLGVEIVVPEGFNTDRFGTFTRDIKRAGNQKEAAEKKARSAMKYAGVDLGVASEGSFGIHPSNPFGQSNLELVLLVDAKLGYTVAGFHRTWETNVAGTYISSVEEVHDFAKKVGFPEHGIVVRKSEKSRFGIYKNITNAEELIAKVETLLAKPFTKKVFLETDMRAHNNPTRMQAIEKATENLIENIQSRCPECHAPGFVAVDYETGLPCGRCGNKTELALYDVYACYTCSYEEKRKVKKYGDSADPTYCGFCNP